MTILYPLQIDTSVNLPTVVDNSTPVDAEVVNRLRDAIIVIETELGVKPSSIYTTVRNRLDVLEALIASGGGGGGGGGGGSVTFGGDLVGNSIHQVVIGFQGRPFSSTAPTTGQAIVWNGSNWAPGNASFTPGGDLTGTSSSQTVIRIQNRDVSSTAPTVGQFLIWDASSTWTPGSNLFGASLTVGPLSSTSLSTGIITLGGKLIVNGIPTSGIPSNPNQGIIYFDSTLERYRVSENGGAYKNLVLAPLPATVGQALIWDGYDWLPGSNFGNNNIVTTGTLNAGPTTVTSISTGLEVLSGKFIINGIGTIGTLSDAGQGIIYFDGYNFQASENGGPYGPIGVNGNYLSANITTTGTLNAGPTVVTSVTTGLEVLTGKFIINNIPTSGTLSDAGQAIIYYDATSNKIKVSENAGPYLDLLGADTHELIYPGSFPDWSTFVDAVFAAPRPTLVHIDADFDVPAGTWVLSSYAKRGLVFDAGGTVRTMHFLDGAIIDAFPPDEFHNISLTTESNSVVFTLSDDGNPHYMLIEGLGIDGSQNPVTLIATGSSPIMTSSAAIIDITFRGDVVLQTSPAPIITSTGGQVYLNIYDSVNIQSNTLSSSNTTLIIYSDAAICDSVNQVGGAATLSIQNIPATKVTTTASPYSVNFSDVLVAVTSGGTITLEASPPKTRTVKIKDVNGIAAASNITVSGNGHNIDGAATYIIGINYGEVELVFTGTQWSIV